MPPAPGFTFKQIRCPTRLFCDVLSSHHSSGFYQAGNMFTIACLINKTGPEFEEVTM